MKKNPSVLKILISILISVAVAFVVFASVYGFIILNDPDVITIGVGEKYTLPTEKIDYTVRSYNAGVVSPVGKSDVEGVSVGEGVVCVKYSYFDRDFYRFEVVPAPENITLNKSELCLGVGETFALNAESDNSTHNFDIKYFSSTPDVATVSDSGDVTAVAVGKSTISAIAYNNIESNCHLEVVNAPTSIAFDKSEAVLGIGDELQLNVGFNEEEYSNSIFYTSSDETVAKIENGKVKGVSVGECVVFAKCYNDVSAECKIEVKKFPETVSLIIPEKHIVGTTFEVLYDIGKDTVAGSVELSVSDENVLKIVKEDNMRIHCVGKGSADITITLQNGVTDTKTVTVDDYSKNEFSFKVLNQYPTLPTGCEVVSLTSVLNHYGMDVSMTTMADEYLPKVSYDYFSVSPHDYFLGNPYSRDGCGCYSRCIVKTAENYFEANNIDDYIAVDISDCSPDELYSYLENDIPVITWVTSGFADPYVSGSWVVGDEVIKWCDHEHCLVTIGYDKINNTVTVADDSGGYNYTVSRSQYEKVFKGMGSMAVVILKK